MTYNHQNQEQNMSYYPTSVSLSEVGLSNTIDMLKKIVKEDIRRYRERPNGEFGDFRQDFRDLSNAIAAHFDVMLNSYQIEILNGQGILHYKIEACLNVFNGFRDILAFAETTVKLDIPDNLKRMADEYDTGFPLDFLVDVESLRAAHPTLRFEMKLIEIVSHPDDEVSF